jgi:hypothetical protein
MQDPRFRGGRQSAGAAGTRIAEQRLFLRVFVEQIAAPSRADACGARRKWFVA